VYLQEAIEYVHSHPKVLKSGIAILGSSKGAAIAFDAASKSDKVFPRICWFTSLLCIQVVFRFCRTVLALIF